MGLGETLVLSSALFWALAVVLFRRCGESLPAFELNLFKNGFGVVLFVPTILLVDGFALPAYDSPELVAVLASGLIGIAVADTWYLKGLNLMGAGRTGIVASLFTPFVMLLSAVFLHERLSPWQWLGFLLVMAGALLVTWRSRRSLVQPADLKKGVLYGIASVLMMAAGMVMVKNVLEARSFLWTVELRMVAGFAGMCIFISLRGGWNGVKRSFGRPQRWPTILLASFVGAYFSQILWLGGYKLLDASVAAVFNGTNVVFIVLLAWLLLGESIDLRKLAGMGLTLAGVIFMVLA